MDLYERTLNTNTVYRGKFLDLRIDEVQLPDGNKSTREIVGHPGAVAIVALTPKEEILMVRQYRKAVDKILWEIPAGKLEPDECIEECARRELTEETGFFPRELKHLTHAYPSPGFTDEILHFFLARELESKYQKPDDDEFIELKMLPFEDVVKMALSGKIEDAKTVIGLVTAYHYIRGLV